MMDPAVGSPSHVLTVSALVIDLPAWQVLLNDEPIHLTPLEFKVLAYLAQNAGRVVPKDELLVWVWKCSPDGKGTGNVDSCVKRLRRKLGEWGQNHIFIVRGMGCKLFTN